ncbi:DUF4097 and DUF4098 domain-containing protein YvlB [Saonia flava]|uniref:DUF4097 and DUF4098 domain-containing protein YvlB n=1 Tax=Saonia flava TaxID=523696 RepID=A0A846QXP6_9FLAO|nr:DUF4097 family beta strand repeat-containing protein [Saonia flava]NJB71720.1 DUF4097 and DUF4098 domain-containing protein YvlB [Saonia flava]
MKSLKITFLACFICATLFAQEDYKKSLDGIEWVKIESQADVTLKTHSSNELLIKSRSSNETPDRAKGLKLVGEGGSDNTNVGFYVIKEGNNLIVRNLKKSESAEIYLPASQNVLVKTTWQGDIKISGFQGEIETTAELNGGITIENVTGPLTANSLNGAIEVLFTKVSQKSPITINTVNGEVDITMPANTPADLNMGTLNGNVYTNFDLALPDKNGLRAVAGNKIKGAINNGGVAIKLNTINGNIYLRKE